VVLPNGSDFSVILLTDSLVNTSSDWAYDVRTRTMCTSRRVARLWLRDVSSSSRLSFSLQTCETITIV